MNGIDMIPYDIAFALGYFCHMFVGYLTRKGVRNESLSK
jgi:hypothetical protein